MKCTNFCTQNGLKDNYCMECGAELLGLNVRNALKDKKISLVLKHAIIFFMISFIFDFFAIIPISINGFMNDSSKIYITLENQLLAPFLILCIIQGLIYEITIFIKFHGKYQLKEYEPYYLFSPSVHFMLLFAITFILQMTNVYLDFVNNVLFEAVIYIGIIHYIVRILVKLKWDPITKHSHHRHRVSR